ncbi:unnamed protein product [Coffea canephora]|uniref:Formin-like protein 18 n=1 Tax=Coffea canephora TaxID=49390 RepID=A0A068TM81_COFCA|nr:unnamed protein product [Coffea canephora]
MDPCPFVRIVIGNLALRLPPPSSWSKSTTTTTLCYCKIKLKGFPTQYSTVPWLSQESGTDAIENRIHAGFNFKKLEFEKLVEKSGARGGTCGLKIEIYTGKGGNTTAACGWKLGGKLLGSVSVQLDLKATEHSNKGCVIQDGWIGTVGGGSGKGVELHVNVRAEPDPRFVFQFDGEPECSPQVFQVNGNVKQPVFSCKFGFRSCGERNLRSRSSMSEPNTRTGCFSASFPAEKERPLKERKGWSITIHDLSGSPVAAASMVTPFVASPGSDRVSRSNPGAWLILRPGHGTWKPWGRLEAWRERNGGDHLGYRFELIPDGSIDTITLANSSFSTKKGGKFSIDIASGSTPLTSPNSSFDFSSASSGSGSGSGSGSWGQLLYRGFVMSSTVEGDGKCSKPEVEIGVQHVTCTEDAAAFVALAAAVDLSMDACRSFSQKIRRELRQPDQEY